MIDQFDGDLLARLVERVVVFYMKTGVDVKESCDVQTRLLVSMVL